MGLTKLNVALQTPAGQAVSAKVGDYVDVADQYVDYLMPEDEEKPKDEDDEDKDEDKEDKGRFEIIHLIINLFLFALMYVIIPLLVNASKYIIVLLK